MHRFSKEFLKVALGLAAAVLLVAPAVQTGSMAAASEPLLVAQSAESKAVKPSPPAPTPQKQGRIKSMAPEPCMPKEEMNKSYQKGGDASVPAATGTKKIGGQTIRGKETPEKE